MCYFASLSKNEYFDGIEILILQVKTLSTSVKYCKKIDNILIEITFYYNFLQCIYNNL